MTPDTKDREVELRVALSWVCWECGHLNFQRGIELPDTEANWRPRDGLRPTFATRGKMVVMASVKVTCGACGVPDVTYSEDPQEFQGIFLSQTYSWTCDECGRENFQPGCPTYLPDGSIGMVPPHGVVCPHCQIRFRVGGSYSVFHVRGLEDLDAG